MPYQPGLHIIATLQVTDAAPLEHFGDFQLTANQWIADFELTKLGEVYHNFSPAGFTGVICLSESHISIHTWPEHHKVNLDIYLSNFKQENDEKVEAIYDRLKALFGGQIENEQRIRR